MAGLVFLIARPVDGQHQGAFQESTPEELGIKSSTIFELIEKFEQEVDAVHSLMILRHGKLVSQGWWAPYQAESPHVLHSLSKSFTSTGIGIAVDEGILSLDDPVLEFFPELSPQDPSWQMRAMRIRDLLTMNTGHRQEPRLFNVKKNWVRTFLHSEVEFKPGTHFQYNSAATYMLSAILQKVSGERLVEYLDKRLFQPLGIEKPHWDLCPDGINTGGWGLRVTTEDIAKLGQLYLQKGIWNGRRILSESWTQKATQKQTSNGSNPMSDWDQGYGYQFWMCRHDCFRGDGAFGQYCIVIPEYDMVIAITSGASNMGTIMNIIWDIMLPNIYNEALPSNPTSLERLNGKLNNLVLPTITSTIKDIPLSKNAYKFNENKQGITFVSFENIKNQNIITFHTKNQSTKIQVGHQSFVRNNFKPILPFAANVGSTLGAQGQWIEDNVFKMKLYFIESPASITYTLEFDDEGNQITIKSTPKHSLFGPRQTTDLIGYAR